MPTNQLKMSERHPAQPASPPLSVGVGITPGAANFEIGHLADGITDDCASIFHPATFLPILRDVQVSQ